MKIDSKTPRVQELAASLGDLTLRHRREVTVVDQRDLMLLWLLELQADPIKR